MKNVGQMIEDIDYRIASAEEECNECRNKSSQKEWYMNESWDEDSRTENRVLRDYYFNRVEGVEEYIEGLKELREFLSNIDPSTSAALIDEKDYVDPEKVEQEICNEEGDIMECINPDDGTAIVLMCYYKSLSNL